MTDFHVQESVRAELRRRRLARIERTRMAYLAEDDDLRAAELLGEYELAVSSHLELEELDWTVCFACAYPVVVDGKLNGRGQWFGSWAGYSMAMLCSHCAPETRLRDG